jgi:hypothetical protein
MRTCGAAHAGRTSYRVVVHNESTDHDVRGPERWSVTAPFGTTFDIHRWDANDPEDPDPGFVWSWIWEEAGSVPSAE